MTQRRAFALVWYGFVIAALFAVAAVACEPEQMLW